jgi:hypothetical protein
MRHLRFQQTCRPSPILSANKIFDDVGCFA